VDASPSAGVPGKIAFLTANNSQSATERVCITSDGNFGVHASAPDAIFEVETATTTGQQAMTIDQNDDDQAFIDFQGTSGVGYSIGTTEKSTYYRMIMIEINGTKCWLKAYQD
jgi:hypothetical protein